jgi:CO dehydrogenase nickel-insertion accessory protein CooC1
VNCSDHQEVKMNTKNLNLAGKRIGVFGKGGSGKSTFVVLLATALCKQGYKVCVLDADSTNLGLSQALGIKNPPQTLLEYYGGMVFSGGKVTCPVDDPTYLEGAEISIAELPKEYYARNEDGLILLSAGKIGAQGPGAGCDGPIAKIARDVVIASQECPITLIDFKAGFEDTARGVMSNLDWAMVVVDPTVASVEIAANLREMVVQIQQDVLPATAHLESPEMVALANRIFTDARIEDLFVVLNKVPSWDVEDYLRDQLANHGLKPIGVIYEDASIPLAWLKGQPVNTNSALSDVQIVAGKLERFADGYS